MLFKLSILLGAMLTSSQALVAPQNPNMVLSGSVSGNTALGNSTQNNNVYMQRNATNLITNHINNTLNEHIKNDNRIYTNATTTYVQDKRVVENIVNNYQQLVQAAAQPGYAGPPIPPNPAQSSQCNRAGRRGDKKKYLKLLMDARRIADESLALAMDLLQKD